jgi:NAD(P)-dependent dehydrogenase (short-subunit alcohol dehydrogenase family)
MLLTNKVVLITGGAGPNGLGFASAKMLAAQGARVVIVDLPQANAVAAACASGEQHIGLSGDVTDPQSCQVAVQAALAHTGYIDILLNNAGIAQSKKTLDITQSDYDAVLDVSLRGTLNMTQAVLPFMQVHQSGSIICMSSVSAQRGGGILGGAHYSAAKAGILGLSRAMAREFGADNIRVNCITPGLIETDINKGLIPDNRIAGILKQIPLNRIGAPDDVAGCVLFLASDLSKYVTGVTLDVNGGMLIH